MQVISEEFKIAISKPSREIKSRITLPGLTLDDDNIQTIDLDSSLVFGEDFEIGTAPMDTAKVELIVDEGEWGRNLIQYNKVVGHGCSYELTGDKYKNSPIARIRVTRPDIVNNFGIRFLNVRVDNITEYFTMSFYFKINKYVNSENRIFSGYLTVIYSDDTSQRHDFQMDIDWRNPDSWHKWHDFARTFIVPEGKKVVSIENCYIYADNTTTGDALLTVPKLEKGSTATPWSPAPEDILDYNYEDKESSIKLGIMLEDESIEYVDMGLYTIEKAVKKDNKITLDCVDRMYKAEVDFENNLMFPTTILDILQSACEQSDIELATTAFANSDYIVPNEPVFEGITCRHIFAQVAELAGGYAKINRQGKLEIITLGNASVREITKDHYFELNTDEVAVGKVDKVIVKVGEEAAEQGIGDNIYTIVDNMFVQDPADVIDPVFNVLKNVNYSACGVKWQGDFSLDLGDKITIDGYETYVLDRKLSYTGGLGEDYKAPAKSNVERNSTGKSNIILDINNIKTQVKVIEGEITQTIESIEGEVKNEVAEQMKTAEIYTWIKYANDEYGNGISDNPAGKKYVGIATNKKNVEPSNTPDDYEWSLIKGDKGAQGEPGKDGIPGEPGKDGESQYTYIRYSINSNGNPMTTTPTGATKYIGLAVTTSSTAPSGYASYTWQKFVGDDGSDGAQGQQGIPGTPGEDGTTYYTWIKYATTPTTGMSDNPAGKDYIGIAHNKTTATESTSYNDYTWSLIKGEDGEDGQTTYTWIMYANDVLGNGISDVSEDKRYVGIATNKPTPSKSVNPNDYEWSPLYDNVEIGGANRLYDSRANIEFTYGDWGRNLYLDGSYEDGVLHPVRSDGWSIVNSPLSLCGSRVLKGEGREGIYAYHGKDIPIEPNTDYTASVWVYISSDFVGANVWLRVESDVNVSAVADLTIRDEWQRISITRTSTASATKRRVLCYVVRQTAGYVLYDCIKLEKGSTPTPWTPAPEDVDGWLDIKLIRGPGNPYYKVVSPHADFTSLSVGFPNSRFAEPLESLGRVTVSLDVMVEVDREVTINGSTFVVPGNRWTRIFFTKEFTENNNTSTRVLTPYSRKRKVIRNISTNLIDELRTDINTLYYRNLQVEQGNVPTSYNLTPEELEGEITRSKTEIKQLKDSILLVATRNENTGRFEITPESIVQAIDSTDGVGRLKTTKVTVDENGLTVDNGAILIRDNNNQALITSYGLKMKYVFVSNGNRQGWQNGGLYYDDYNGIFRRGEALLYVYIPSDFIIESAILHAKSMPYYRTNDPDEHPDGYYHVAGMRLYKADDDKDVCIWVDGHHTYDEPTIGSKTDITSSTWGSAWSPTGREIQIKSADVKEHLKVGGRSVLVMQSNLPLTHANSIYQSLIQMELEITGFLRG